MIPWLSGLGGNGAGVVKERDGAPENENNHHDRGYAHDLQRLPAGLMNALRIFLPKVECDRYAEHRRKCVVRKMPEGTVKVLRNVVNETNQVLSCHNRA